MRSWAIDSIRVISFAAAAGASPNLSLVPGEHMGMGVGRDAGDDAHEHVLRPPAGNGRLQAVDIVFVVDGDEADPVLDGHGDFGVALRVPMQHEERRVDTCLERTDDLTAAGHVEPQAFLDHHALDRSAGKRLRGEHHA
jgi:hypothetical protein